MEGSDRYILRGKNTKSRNLLREHGHVWYRIREYSQYNSTISKVPLSPNGTWKHKACRWVSLKNDDNFEIVDSVVRKREMTNA